MRIIAGAKRGMKLFSPKTDVSRPITDRVKESLFSVLWNYGFPKGKMVADLFCGVGSLGLEALSRGAEFVTFVEKDPKIIATLRKNIEKAGFGSESKVIRADAFKVGAPVLVRRPSLGPRDPFSAWGHLTVERRATSDGIYVARGPAHVTRGERRATSDERRKYDLIFVDPPYSALRETKEGSTPSKLLALLSEQASPNGIVVVRTEKRIELLKQYGQLEVIERRQWGTMAVTIFRRLIIDN